MRRLTIGLLGGVFLLLAGSGAAHAQTDPDVWSASVAVEDSTEVNEFGDSTTYLGFYPSFSIGSLSDSTFTYNERDYEITRMISLIVNDAFGTSTRTQITLDTALGDDADALQLSIADSTFHLGDAFVFNSTYVWYSTVPNWTAGDTVTASISVPPPSGDADLTALTLSGVTLSPAFHADSTSYTGSAPNSVDTTTVIATPSDPAATVDYTGDGRNFDADPDTPGFQVPLRVTSSGVLIEVKVTAPERATKTYTVRVVRAPSSDADLSALSLSGGTLTPAFHKDSLNYAVTFPYSVDTTTVAATTSHVSARAAFFDGPSGLSPVLQDADAGTPGLQVALDVGTDTLTVEVLAADFNTTKSYTLVVTREAPPPAPTVSSLAFSAASADSVYAIGDAVSVTVTFSDSVEVLEGNLPQFDIDVGGSDKTFTYDSGSGSPALVFGYVVAEGDLDTNGIEIAENALDLNGGTIRLKGTSGSTTVHADIMHGAVAADPTRKVDGVRPTLSSWATSADGTQIVLTFSETLATTTALQGSFTVAVADTARTVDEVEVSGATVTLTLATAVVAGQTVTVAYTDPSGSDDANAVQDRAGNDAATFSTDASLSGLELSGVTLTPTFHKDSLSYTSTVANSVEVTTVSATTSHGSATVAYFDGSDQPLTDADGADGFQVALDVGTDTIRVKVTALDGVTQKTYTVVVTREAPPPAPTVSSLVLSEAGADSAYAIGDSVSVTVTFSDSVEVTGVPQLDIDVDGSDETLTYDSGSGTPALVFTGYVVAENDEDTDGIAIAENELVLAGGTIRLKGTTVDAVITHAAVAADPARRVDGVRPTLSNPTTSVDGTQIVLASSEPLSSGEVAAGFTVTVASSPRGIYSASASGSSVTLTLRSAVGTGQPVTVAYAEPSTDDGAVRDAASNDLATFAAETVSNISGVPAVFPARGDTIWAVDMTVGTLIVPQTSSDVHTYGYHVVAALGRISGPAEYLYDGTSHTVGAVNYFDVISGGSVLSSQLTLQVSPLFDSAPDHLLVLTLDDEEFRLDAATPNAARREYRWNNPGLTWTDGDTIAVKLIAIPPPSVTSIAVVDAPSDDTYAIGDTIGLAVTFTKDVTLYTNGGTPELELTVGDSTRTATCASASGTQLTCLYPVAEGIEGEIGVAANKLTLEGGTLRGPYGLSADTTYTADEVSIDAALRVDGIRPTLVTSGDDAPTTSADGTQIVLTFSETLSSTTAPDTAFAVTVDGDSRTVDQAEASGAAVTLTLESAVAAGEDVTVAYTDPSAGDDGSAVQDAAGNDAATFSAQTVTNSVPSADASLSGLSLSDVTLTPTFHTDSLSYASTVANAVDTTTVSATASHDSATVAYFDGSDQALTDAGAADGFQVALDVGTDTIKVKVTAQDGNTTKTYTVVVTRQAPPAAPTVFSLALSDAGTDSTYAIGDTVSVTVTFSDSVDVTGTPQLVLDVGTSKDTLTYDSGSTTPALVFTGYVVAEGDEDTNGIAIAANALDLNGGTIRRKGSTTVNAIITHAAVAADPARKVDGVRPTLVTSGDDAPTTSADGTQILLTFSETLSGTTAPGSAFAVTVDGNSRNVQQVDASGTAVTLTLASAVAVGEEVTVAYTDPSAGDDGSAVQDAAGNDAATFSAQTVTNRTGTDASLSALSLSGVTLAPTFHTDSLNYTAAVSNSLSSTTVDATKSDASATVQYLDGSDRTLADADAAAGFQVVLDVGANAIKVKVTAEDGITTRTYTVAVTRAQAPISTPTGTLAVSNIGQTAASAGIPLKTYRVAHGFRTAPDGSDYVVESVVVKFKTAGAASGVTYKYLDRGPDTLITATRPDPVKIFLHEWTSGAPGRGVGAFEQKVATAGDNTFKFRGTEPLGRNKHYVVLITTDNTTDNVGNDPGETPGETPAELAQTASNTEDTGGKSGWDLDADYFSEPHSQPQWPKQPWSTNSNGAMIRVNVKDAPADPGEGLRVHDTSVYESDLTVTVQAEGRTERYAALDFRVTLDPAPPSGERVSVYYRTVDSSSGSCSADHFVNGRCITTARAPQDYIPKQGQLIFNSLEGSKTVQVLVVDDIVEDSGEALELVLGPGRVEYTNGNWKDKRRPTVARSRGLGTIYNSEEAASPSDVLVADATVAEGDSATLDFVVSLSAATTGTVSFDYATEDGTATDGEDYTGQSGRIALVAGETAATISVPVTDDSHAEGDETLTLTLTNVRHANFADEADTLRATGTIEDDDLPALSVADATATEAEGATLDFVVTLDPAASGTVTVAYATADGTATANVDYTPTSGKLTLEAGETTKTIAVPITLDTVDDDGETLTLTLSEPSGAELADAEATGTIQDFEGHDRPHDLQATVAEGAVVLTWEDPTTYDSHDLYHILRHRPELGEAEPQVYAEYAHITDRTFTDTAVVAGVLYGYAVKAVKDVFGNLGPMSEIVEVRVPADTTASSSILSVSDASADEGDAVEFTVSLSTASSQQVTVQYATSGGSATSGTDFTDTSGTLEFAAGAMSKTVSVATTEDTADEEDETFTLTLSGATHATLGDSTATGTIEDDDENLPTLDVSDASATEGDDVEFMVSLSAASSQKVTVGYAMSGGTATSGTDFTDASGTLEFAAGATSKTVSVATTEDTADEEDETFTLTLSGATHATLGDSTATGTIEDDDETPPTLSVSDASAAEGDDVEFTVSLSAASSQQVTVGYATSGGTATSGTDFTAKSSTLTFAANVTSKTVSVATTDDTADEEDETFTLTLSSPVNATLGDATATGTIEDDDEPPPLTAAFSGMPDSHDGSSEFTFTLTFSEEIDGLSYVTLRDSAFVVAEGDVRKAQRQEQGQNQKWTITVKPDGNADVTIELPATTDCGASGAICTSDQRKLSNSESDTVEGPVIVPAVSVSDASATEGEAVVFTVSLSAASSRQVTVGYATSGGTATSGTDFTGDSGTLTFAASTTSKTVSIATTEDSMDENDETFTLTLSSPTGATLGAATATGTIIDDDEAPKALTASFSGMPDSHTGQEFDFGLTFSEEPRPDFSYRTLRDSAFVVASGEVRKARRKEQGKNKAWTITVEPDSATVTVIITLPATTSCTASGAICTEDGRKLSEAVSDTVVAAASQSAGDAQGDAVLDDALGVLDGVTPDQAPPRWSVRGSSATPSWMPSTASATGTETTTSATCSRGGTAADGARRVAEPPLRVPAPLRPSCCSAPPRPVGGNAGGLDDEVRAVGEHGDRCSPCSSRRPRPGRAPPTWRGRPTPSGIRTPRPSSSPRRRPFHRVRGSSPSNGRR